jgi:hypothetical protein
MTLLRPLFYLAKRLCTVCGIAALILLAGSAIARGTSALWFHGRQCHG